MSRAAELESELATLRERRERLNQDLADADIVQEREGLALAASGSKKSLEAASLATSRVAAIRGAIATLDRSISEKETEFGEARVREEREAHIEALMRVAADGCAARAEYEEGLKSLRKLLEKRVPEVVAAFSKFCGCRTDFINTARGLAPGILNDFSLPPRGRDEITGWHERQRQQSEQAEELISELKAKGADLSAVSAEVTLTRTTLDQNYSSPDLGHFEALILNLIMAQMAVDARATEAAGRVQTEAVGVM